MTLHLPTVSGFLPDDPCASHYTIYVASFPSDPIRLLATVHDGLVEDVTVHGPFSPRCYNLDLSGSW